MEGTTGPGPRSARFRWDPYGGIGRWRRIRINGCEKCTISKQVGNLSHTGFYQKAQHIILLLALSLLFHSHPPNLVPMSTMSIDFFVICLRMKKWHLLVHPHGFLVFLCNSVLQAQDIAVIEQSSPCWDSSLKLGMKFHTAARSFPLILCRAFKIQSWCRYSPSRSTCQKWSRLDHQSSAAFL